MKISFVPIPVVVLAALSIADLARADDEGERRAVTYNQEQEKCALIPKFSEGARAIGQTTGDVEKDTYAYPVQRNDRLCMHSEK